MKRPSQREVIFPAWGSGVLSTLFRLRKPGSARAVETPGSAGTKTEPAADRAAAELGTAADDRGATAENGCAPSPGWDPAREIAEELDSAWASESALSPPRPEAFSSADVQFMVRSPPYLAAPTGVAELMPVATPIA